MKVYPFPPLIGISLGVFHRVNSIFPCPRRTLLSVSLAPQTFQRVLSISCSFCAPSTVGAYPVIVGFFGVPYVDGNRSVPPPPQTVNQRLFLSHIRQPTHLTAGQNRSPFQALSGSMLWFPVFIQYNNATVKITQDSKKHVQNVPPPKSTPICVIALDVIRRTFPVDLQSWYIRPFRNGPFTKDIACTIPFRVYQGFISAIRSGVMVALSLIVKCSYRYPPARPFLLVLVNIFFIYGRLRITRVQVPKGERFLCRQSVARLQPSKGASFGNLQS